MTHMLAVPAFQVRHPISLLVSVEANDLTQCPLRQYKLEQRGPRRHSYVLLSIDRVGHGRGDDACATLKMPQCFSAFRIERDEIPFRVASEDDSSGRRKRPRPAR